MRPSLKNELSHYDQVIPEKLKLYLALSRTHHGVIDMMSPFLAALLYLGRLPGIQVLLVGFITVFAGYTAIYALNDIAGYRVDRKNIGNLEQGAQGNDIDSVLLRHPLAQGALSMQEAVLWTSGWAALAVIGAISLNPVCVLIFLLGALLEVIYCLLLKITHLRFVISGFVKSAGPVAAVYAVDSDPSRGFVFLIILFHFMWEAGGQNIPNDYTDIDGDSQVRAMTLPIKFGRRFAGQLILLALIVSVLSVLMLFRISPAGFGFMSYLAVLAWSSYLLLLPAWTLNRSCAGRDAMTLFNRASYYPLLLLLIVLMKLAG